jgi:hypothetical protein
VNTLAECTQGHTIQLQLTYLNETLSAVCLPLPQIGFSCGRQIEGNTEKHQEATHGVGPKLPLLCREG